MTAPSPRAGSQAPPADTGPVVPAARGDRTDGVLEQVTHAVALLPGLPPVVPGERYSPRPVTVGWLMAAPENTRRAYFRDLNLWLTWCDQHDVDPMRARRVDADAWTVTLTGSRRTIARRLAGVSSWYRYLVSNDVVDRNPFTAVTRPAVNRDTSPTVGLTPEQAATILDTADTDAARKGSEAALRDAVLLRILLDTGIRVGSLLSADVSSVEHDSGHRVLRYVNKGGHHKRTVLPPHVVGILDQYLAVRAAREGVPVGELTGPLLTTTPYQGQPGGKRLAQKMVYELVRRTARRAGIPQADKLSPHSLRRTFVTLALKHAPLERVQAAVGHQDPRTTLLYQDGRDSLDSSPVYRVAGELAERQHTNREGRADPDAGAGTLDDGDLSEPAG